LMTCKTTTPPISFYSDMHQADVGRHAHHHKGL
jgi:hypothetical protein